MSAIDVDKILSSIDDDLPLTADQLCIKVDVGNMSAFNPRPVNTKELKSNQDEYLLEHSCQSVQMIVNQLFKLPAQPVDDVIVVKLPKGSILPREKSLPKTKAETKWEKYAKLKGIKKVKKPRKVYDEIKKEWRPTYGYKRKDDVTKDWLIEINKNERDVNQDFFAKRTSEKNERKAKNELQRLRNVGRSMKSKVPGVGNNPHVTTDNPDKLHVNILLVQINSNN
jgi:regulator of ribosome biosynthesis